MIEKLDADELLAGPLGEWLATQDEIRAKTKKKVWAIFAVGLILGPPLAIYGFVSPAPFSIFMGFFLFLAFGIVALLVRGKVTDRIKDEINGAVANALGIEFDRVAHFGHEFELARAFDLVPSHDKRKCEDCWSGEIGGTEFSLYEAHLERRGSGENDSDRTVFRGIIMRFNFQRTFHGITLVKRDKKIKLKIFGDSKKRLGHQLDRVQMVDPRLEDAFDIYGTDQVEARYLVHPEYCERLIELEQRFKGKRIAMLFYGGEVVLTMWASNMFESGTLSPEKDRERLGKTIEQFGQLGALVTYLNEHSRDMPHEDGPAHAEDAGI